MAITVFSQRFKDKNTVEQGTPVVPSAAIATARAKPPSVGNFTLLSQNYDSLTVADPISTADMKAAVGSTTNPPTARESIRTFSGRGNILNYHHTAGAYGTGDGVSMFPALAYPVDEATITYDYYMTGDWGWGGKMPGLGGVLPGQGNPPTGGSPSPYGWTCRGMWITNHVYSRAVTPAEWIGYFYAPYQTSGTYGLNLWTGQPMALNTWCTVTQYYKMNTVLTEGNNSPPADGVHRMWFNGTKVYEDTSVIFRFYEAAKITHLCWSSFFGGATASWAPTVDTDCKWDNLEITTPEGP